jgi:1,2-diacylglycerol 3-beta-galactosyltransferase
MDIVPADLQEILFSADFVRRLTGVSVEDHYNRMLRRGATIGMRGMLRFGQLLIRLRHPAIVKLLRKYWEKTQPSLVVSFVPNFNRPLRESLDRDFLHTPLVTIMTDLADYPPHFWIEPQDQLIICGTARAAEQAREAGFPPQRIRRTSGMIVNPRFYERSARDKEGERERRGLLPRLPTGLVCFGAQGSRIMRTIVEELERSAVRLQLICLCGRDESLAAGLRDRAWRMPVLVEGFTTEMPYFMRLADFFIGKPGPGAISEALLMKLPVIVESNARTLPWETYNAEWIVENGLGIVVRSFRSIAEAAARLLEPEVFDRCKKNVESMENRAVFEAADILEELLLESSGS